MVGPSCKTPTEVSEKNTKFQPLSNCVSGHNKVMLEGPPNKKIPDICLPPEMAAKNCGKNCDHQVKMQLLPRNPGKETSEGVQEFIKHVSDIIEKKTPLKETTRGSCEREGEKNENSPAYQSIQFNGVSKNFHGRKKSEDLKLERDWETDMVERHKNFTKNTEHTDNSAPFGGKHSACVKGKTRRRNSCTICREYCVSKYERAMTPKTKRTDLKTIKNMRTNCSLYHKTEGQDVTFHMKTPLSQEGVSPLPLKNPFKGRRPSEIPLRKDRMNLIKKPKPLSLLLRKPLESVESRASVYACSREKPFSPVEELAMCSELEMTIKLDLSSEKINFKGEKIQPFSEKAVDIIKLARCCKSPNVTEISKLSDESEKEKSSVGKKSKVIDCERVNTSSFSALNSKNTVLDRLEFLHKKNVHSKSFSGKRASQMQKDLTLKTSCNTLKGKSSKKCLFSRLSGKGNKSGLSMKAKRAKGEGDQVPGNSRNLKQQLKTGAESPHLDIYKDIMATAKVGCLIPTSRKVENYRSEGLKTNPSKAEKDEGQPPKVKSARRKSSPKKSPTPREREKPDKSVVIGVVSGSEFEIPKYEKPKSSRNGALDNTEGKEALEVGNGSEKDVETAVEVLNAIPTTPLPTPENRNGLLRDIEEDDEWASKTVVFDDKFNNENDTWCKIESEMEPADAEIITEKLGLGSAEKAKAAKSKPMELVIRGVSLSFGKDEPLDGPQRTESPSVKKQLKINLSAHGVSSDCGRLDDSGKNQTSSIKEDYRRGSPLDKVSSNVTERRGKEGKSKTGSGSADLVSTEVAEELGPLNLALQKPRKSCLSLKSKLHAKGVRRNNKVRSEAGDRPSPSSSLFLNSDIALQSKTKPDTKVRSGLTKSSKREDKLDVFQNADAIKLRRRNSEPNSFRGYVWKCADSATTKGNKASVSSMTSSLRHLNTDEIDDFIFWEAVPQKMTSCWEMSLYHFKRPWSVLSYSVFRDNRKSSTPGLILENLRNGGTLTISHRRSTINQSERMSCRRENPFDVEPSIAQKNIDIRNWLAALNFPTLPSTSTDVLGQENFSTQIPIGTHNFNKAQMNQKRRRVLPNLKFSDEAAKKNPDEEKKEYRKSTKWNPNNQEGLIELIRRKSGGFVTKEHLSSELSVHRPNVTANFCVYSNSAEESIMAETNDRIAGCEPRKYQSIEVASQPEVSISATIISSGAVSGNRLIEKIRAKEKPPQKIEVREEKNQFGNMLKGELGRFCSEVNIWKYLFLLTLFIILIHYCFMNSYA